MKKNNTLYLNQPINNTNDDAINLVSYVDELESAIKDGAKSIAVTSTFGSGKSSLIQLLEKRYCKLATKFCYINMWSHLNDDADSLSLHKTFLYQFANQISSKKGQFVSKRLNENYGLFNLRANSTIKQIFTFVLAILVIVGLLFTKFFQDYTSLILNSDFFYKNHNTIGIVVFAISAIIAVVLMYNTDLVFSSKNSETSRKIDENEIMDIYNSYIRKNHLRRYVVVIEDLDRTTNYKLVLQFLKELRKYYIPKSKKITFIINIKPEGILHREAKIESQDGINKKRLDNTEAIVNEVFPKVFDYILDLKTINYDNYDIILENLLRQKEEEFKSSNIPVFDSNGKVRSDFEWVIRSKNRNIGIREIKERLNYFLSIYKALKTKFPHMTISIKKCLVSAYLASAYSYEYHVLIDVGINKILDIYASNKTISKDDFRDKIKQESNNLANNEDFCSDLLIILNNGLIEEDYRNYFYNLPENSEFYTADELKLINSLIYHEPVSLKKEDLYGFEKLVEKVSISKPLLIEETLDRLDRLSVDYPLCTVLSEKLLAVALNHDAYKTWKVLDSLDYRDDFTKTKQYLFRMLSYTSSFNNSNYRRNVINNVLNASEKDIISFRQEIRSKRIVDFNDYIIMYHGDYPLITIPEIKPNIEVLELINFKSPEFLYSTFSNIDTALTKTDMYSSAQYFDLFVEYYKNSHLALVEKEELDNCIEVLNYMIHNDVVIEYFLNEVFEYSDEEILELFIELVNNYANEHVLPDYILDIIEEYNITNKFNQYVCEYLLSKGYYVLYAKNMLAMDNCDLIDYSKKEIIKTINGLDEKYLAANYIKIRNGILSQNAVKFSDYIVFNPSYPVISKNQLNSISDTSKAISIIPVQLITDENYEYFIEYFNRKGQGRKDSYNILFFVTSSKDSSMKKIMFESLDYTKVHYNMIASNKKQEIIDRVKDIYALGTPLGAISFMNVTKTSNEEFEKTIKPYLENENVINAYIEYVENLIQINNTVINNLVDLKTFYAFSERIQHEFYKRQHYKYYVISKTLKDNYFSFEVDKLDKLETTYIEIFTSKESYKKTNSCMNNNERFVKYMIDNKKYLSVTVPEVFIRFSKCSSQTAEIINHVVNTFDASFCIEYYSNIKGFVDRKAAETFVSIMENHFEISYSDRVFDNTHDKLVGGDLKFRHTIARRHAQKAS